MFDWDSANISHLAVHGVLPEEAEQVLRNNPLDFGTQLRNGEERVLHLGETETGRLLHVVVTVREGKLRMVTAFPANKKSHKFYESQKDGTDVKDFGEAT